MLQHGRWEAGLALECPHSGSWLTQIPATRASSTVLSRHGAGPTLLSAAVSKQWSQLFQVWKPVNRANFVQSLEAAAWPGMSTYSLAVIWSVDIGIEHCCYMAMNPDIALSGSTCCDITMASGGRAGYSYQATPLHPLVSRSAPLHSAQTIPFLFLYHLSVTYMNITVAPAVGRPCCADRPLGVCCLPAKPKDFFF